MVPGPRFYVEVTRNSNNNNNDDNNKNNHYDNNNDDNNKHYDNSDHHTKIKNSRNMEQLCQKKNSINLFYLLLNTRYLVFSKFKRHCVTYITSHINNSKKTSKD